MNNRQFEFELDWLAAEKAQADGRLTMCGQIKDNARDVSEHEKVCDSCKAGYAAGESMVTKMMHTARFGKQGSN